VRHVRKTAARLRFLAALGLACLALSACGAGAPVSSASPLAVRAISATDTPVPSPSATAAPRVQATVPPAPSPTPTTGPVTYTIDFGAERRDDVTLHVGQAIQLRLTTGPTSDWLSGVDDARVLRPMSAGGNGVYQAISPGTALLTAHVPYGCASVFPGRPCRNPEHGLWFQTRVYVVP